MHTYRRRTVRCFAPCAKLDGVACTHCRTAHTTSQLQFKSVGVSATPLLHFTQESQRGHEQLQKRRSNAQRYPSSSPLEYRLRRYSVDILLERIVVRSVCIANTAKVAPKNDFSATPLLHFTQGSQRGHERLQKRRSNAQRYSSSSPFVLTTPQSFCFRKNPAPLTREAKRSGAK